MGKKIYPYAVARIRMLERSLLTEKEYTQMIDARSADEAMKILMDAGYGEFGMADARDFETLLSAQLSKAYSDVRELTTENFMDVFLYKNDYHNLKVLIKADITETDADAYLIGGGTVDLEVMKNAFAGKNFSTIPYEMQEAVAAAYEAYGKNQSGQAVDIVLDKAAFRQMISRFGANSRIT